VNPAGNVEKLFYQAHLLDQNTSRTTLYVVPPFGEWETFGIVNEMAFATLSLAKKKSKIRTTVRILLFFLANLYFPSVTAEIFLDFPTISGCFPLPGFNLTPRR
jgi:hypothetical protein